MTREEFSIELYSKKIVLVITDTTKDVKRYVEDLYRNHGEDSSDIYDAYGYTVHFPSKPGIYYVVYSSNDLTFNTVAHEIYHVTKFIISSIVVAEDDMGEMGAYLTGYITDRIIELLIKNKIKIQNGKY